MIATNASLSMSNRRSAPASAATMSSEKAFSFSGRFSVMVAI
jgi:hypothetical protein